MTVSPLCWCCRGFNVVRLGMMWPGVEPKKGQYNETYLAIMKKLVADMVSAEAHSSSCES